VEQAAQRSGQSLDPEAPESPGPSLRSVVLKSGMIPGAAIAIRTAFHTLDALAPTNVVLSVITTPVGLWFVFRSPWVIYDPRNAFSNLTRLIFRK
jgi:hypothetical protein